MDASFKVKLPKKNLHFIYTYKLLHIDTHSTTTLTPCVAAPERYLFIFVPQGQKFPIISHQYIFQSSSISDKKWISLMWPSQRIGQSLGAVISHKYLPLISGSDEIIFIHHHMSLDQRLNSVGLWFIYFFSFSKKQTNKQQNTQTHT